MKHRKDENKIKGRIKKREIYLLKNKEARLLTS